MHPYQKTGEKYISLAFQCFEAPTTTYPVGEGARTRSASGDSDWNHGKGSGSDGTGSVVDPVRNADTIGGKFLE
jgi:hypothetical protein